MLIARNGEQWLCTGQEGGLGLQGGGLVCKAKHLDFTQ